LSLQFYDDARRDLVKALAKIPEVCSVVEYGSVGAPGISDLDLIVGLDDAASERTARLLTTENLPENVREAIAHATLMVMPQTTLPLVRSWDDIQTSLLFGRHIQFQNFNMQEFAVARIVDWLPERICRLHEILMRRSFNTRRALGLLKSTLYSLDGVSKLTGSQNRADLAQSVEECRAGFFELPSTEATTIIPLLQEMTAAAEMSWSDFCRWLERTHHYGSPCREADIEVLRFPNGATYQFTGVQAVQVTEEGVRFHLPPLLSRHFALYAEGDGPISLTLASHMERNHIDADFPLSGPMRDCLALRMSLVNTWARFLMQRGFGSGLFKFGWFYGEAQAHANRAQHL